MLSRHQTHTCTNTRVYTHIYADMHTYMNIHTHEGIHTYTYIHTCICRYAHRHVESHCRIVYGSIKLATD